MAKSSKKKTAVQKSPTLENGKVTSIRAAPRDSHDAGTIQPSDCRRRRGAHAQVRSRARQCEGLGGGGAARARRDDWNDARAVEAMGVVGLDGKRGILFRGTDLAGVR